jgi:hypothetical protein
MNRGTDKGGVARQFDPEKLVVAVNQSFDGFHFTIQTFRPAISYADRVKAWFEARAAAEDRGIPFNEPQPVLSYTGPATFDSCAGEERESGFVLMLSMKTEAGRPFKIFIEEEYMVPESDSYLGSSIESSIADHLAFWTQEMICHGTVEELDGRAVYSGTWLKTWT